MEKHFPSKIWYGKSDSRDPVEGISSAPDAHDWAQIVGEMAAVQEHLGLGAHGGASSAGEITANSLAKLQRTTISLDNARITLSADTGTAAVGGIQVFQSPVCYFFSLGVVLNLTLIEKTTANVDDDFGGKVAVGVKGVTGYTITGTEENLLAESPLPPAVSGQTWKRVMANTHQTYGGMTPTGIYVNFTIPDEDHTVDTGACDLLLSGNVHLLWVGV